MKCKCYIDKEDGFIMCELCKKRFERNEDEIDLWRYSQNECGDGGEGGE